MEMHDLEDTVLVTSDLLFIKQVSYEEMNQRNLFVFIDMEQYFLFNLLSTWDIMYRNVPFYKLYIQMNTMRHLQKHLSTKQ